MNISFEPPKPIKQNDYWCDKRFHVEDIEGLFSEDAISHALIMIGGDETSYYQISWHNNKVVDRKLLERFTILRDKRQKNGGQSSHRFQMNRLLQIAAYIKRICEGMNKYYDTKKTSEIVIVGTGEVRDKIRDNIHLRPSVLEKIKSVDGISKLDIEEATTKFINIMSGSVSKENQKIVEVFMNHVIRSSGKIIYGEKEVIQYLETNMLETLIVNTDYKNMEEVEKLYKSNNKKCKFYKVNDTKIHEFGGIVGILYYEIDIANVDNDD